MSLSMEVKLSYYPLSMGNYKLITILIWCSRFLRLGKHAYIIQIAIMIDSYKAIGNKAYILNIEVNQ